ncbi:MAG: hypothetical protein DMF92_16390 [Acidobacteria bacterium]|nr:MAG: hypothetical protein DMF92_16390 [Acidobacteriota bacterium]
MSRWEQAQVFDRDGACEDARLQALADYDASVRAVDRRHQGRERHCPRIPSRFASSFRHLIHRFQRE